MMPTRDELIAALKKKPLVVHRCSICSFACCFTYTTQLLYDSWCDCMTSPIIDEAIVARKDEDLDFYLDPSNGWEDKLSKFVGTAGDRTDNTVATDQANK